MNGGGRQPGFGPRIGVQTTVRGVNKPLRGNDFEVERPGCGGTYRPRDRA